MIKCPSCGYENVDGTQFCEGCGEELAGTTAGAGAAAPVAATPNFSGGAAVSSTGTDAAMVKCPACDNLNPPENVVCEVCGTELRADAGASFDALSSPPAVPAPPAQNAAPPMPATPPTPATTPFDTAVPAPPTPDVAIQAPDFAAQQAGVPDVTTTAVTPPTSAMPDPSAVASSPPANVTPDIPAAPPVAAGAALQPGSVKMVVEQGMSVGKQFVLGDAELLVGREDEEEAIYPDIDLSDQDEGYVHRRHATLRFENGQLTVTHLGGANKTRINNRPLPDNEPQPVNVGDKVAFGKVVLRVHQI
jgi:hypothetical protein